MARQGYIHDKLDLKMLELYLLARAAGPIGPDTLAELTMRHEGVECGKRALRYHGEGKAQLGGL